MKVRACGRSGCQRPWDDGSETVAGRAYWVIEQGVAAIETVCQMVGYLSPGARR